MRAAKLSSAGSGSPCRGWGSPPPTACTLAGLAEAVERSQQSTESSSREPLPLCSALDATPNSLTEQPRRVTVFYRWGD